MSERVFMVTAATSALGRAAMQALAPHGRVHGVRAPDEPAPVLGAASVHVGDLTRAHDVRDLMLGVIAEEHVDTIVHLGHDGPPSATAIRLLLDGAEQAPQLTACVVQSSAALYCVDSDDAFVIDEHHPLDFRPAIPKRQRAWLEADVTAGQRIASARVHVSVLRLSEVLDRDVDGGLQSYLAPRACLRPLGFDPMLNVLSLSDAARALALAAITRPRGIFNVQGADSLPLSELVHRAGCVSVPMPDALIAPLYALRRSAGVAPSVEFRYPPLRARFHYGAIPDGRAALQAFGYAPAAHVAFERLRSHSP